MFLSALLNTLKLTFNNTRDNPVDVIQKSARKCEYNYKTFRNYRPDSLKGLPLEAFISWHDQLP